MAIDLALDRGSGSDPEPGLQDRCQLPAFARSNPDDQLVALVRALTADDRALPSCPAGHDPQAVRLSAEPEETAIAERSELRQLLVLAGLSLQVPPQPGLALGHERLGEALGLASGASRSRGDGDDGDVPGIDCQTKVAGSHRSPDRELEGASGEPERGAPLGRRRRHCGKGNARRQAETPDPGRAKAMGQGRAAATASIAAAVAPSHVRAGRPGCCNIRGRVGL